MDAPVGTEAYSVGVGFAYMSKCACFGNFLSSFALITLRKKRVKVIITHTLFSWICSMTKHIV